MLGVAQRDAGSLRLRFCSCAPPFSWSWLLKLRWDIFCRVVDNFGDIGVCWRLCCQLAAAGQQVRLWVDDPAALAWMAPQGCPGVSVHARLVPGAGYRPADVLVSAFDAQLDGSVIEAIAQANADAGAGERVLWIGLEYLSAEPYVERSHGLASPVHGGAHRGVHKWLYFPGFTPASGGLPREQNLLERQSAFERSDWLARQGIAWQGEPLVSLFCYEPPALLPLLRALDAAGARLLVTAGRAGQAVREALAGLPAGAALRRRLDFLPLLSQEDYDHLLWSCDLNAVRGEDSLVRALWAGTGLLWQAYPQADQAHHDKLLAFLDWLQAPPALRHLHQAWNGAALWPDGGLRERARGLDWAGWRACVAAARERLLLQEGLAARLLRFVAENR